MIDIEQSTWSLNLRIGQRKVVNLIKCKIPYASKDAFKFSYFPKKIIDKWNCLPEDIVSARSLDSFNFIHFN